ncbi:MAG: DUF6048 family protein [Bacteroidales bacterium]|nr:DUF6048 family protein [Bacteroidales bacterium]MDD3431522.1 DUF6048 family protein [Bacteroidales bacterium]MDD4430298.1 DUF6048 family protein [Bacteroidales bacterium]
MSKFIYSLLIFSTLSLTALAQTKPKAAKDSVLYHGTQLGISLAEPLKSFFSPTWGSSVQLDVNLLNRFFPLIELGYAQAKLTNQDQSSRFDTKGLYFRAGINLPLATEGPNAENQFFVGARFGFSSFDYSISGGSFEETYWNDSYMRDFPDEHARATWGELLAGLRIQLWGPISLGWSGRMKTSFKIWNGAHSVPAYIPGYGRNQKPNYDLLLHLYYRLPDFKN